LKSDDVRFDIACLRAVVDALVKIGKPAVNPLIEVLNDKNKDIRLVAVVALGEIKDKRAIPPLIEALKDEDWCVRFAAAKALGEIKDKRAVSPLIEALKDENVHGYAAIALRKITGKNFGEDYEKWMKWWRKNK